ncbi:MAG: HDIG domain-containing protein [Puniceicoccales bacterium]|jgi:putative nucleotidyltransferase with HDIG domain|nr:HDIG domain-containing protein [Puniceicoccales bacterium]
MWPKKKSSCENGSSFTLRGKYNLGSEIYRIRYKITQNVNWVEIGLVVLLAFIVTLICFVGQELMWVQLIPNAKARIQVIAEVPFEYVSHIKTQRLKEQRRNLVAPIYKIDPGVYDRFEKIVYKLDELLDSFAHQRLQGEAYAFEMKNFVRRFNEQYNVDIGWGDVDTLLRRIDEFGRTGVLIDGLKVIHGILNDGIMDEVLANQRGSEYFLNIEVEGIDQRVHNRTVEEGIHFFKLRLSSVDATADVLEAIFRLLKTGIRANISFDNVATAQKITRILRETPEVIEKVFSGKTIVTSGSIVTDEEYECLSAYRAALQEAHVTPRHINDNVLERFFIVLATLFLIYLFFKTTRPDLRMLTHKEVFLAVLLLLLNLFACRVVLWCFESKIWREIIEMVPQSSTFYLSPTVDPLQLFPYLLPFTLSCLLGTLLLRTYIGVLLGVTTAILGCLMSSQSIEFFTIMLIIIFASIYFVRHSYMRTQIIRSGVSSGIILGFSAIILSWGVHLSYGMIFFQILLGFFNCLFSGMFVLTVLPIFENLFKCCTNIRLIELTDYTNPLLTKLQIFAPGTYHHSLMVANLSEQAAINIQANPFLCRTLALYHDIGKLRKPEYFTENQNDKNFHDDQTPFMSALIIKNHVKDGVAIAKDAGLPPRIIDGIIEHHGTTVIRYFYTKAVKQNEIAQSSDPSARSEIERSAFTYDGPRPQSKETLLLAVADSLEAASRSLRNPTAQSIENLVNNIIDGKIKERQFDECCVTFRDIEKLRKSFYFTLLNMLHSRIGYDDIQLTNEPS